MQKSIYSIILFLAGFTVFGQTDSWQTYNTNFSDVSGILHAPAKDTVFIHRVDGSLLRSFNGGATWDSTFIRHDSTYFTEVGSYFLNGKIGFTWSIWSCMYTGGSMREIPMLLKTTNSGTSWEPIMNGLTQNPIAFSLVHFWDKDNGFAIGSCLNLHGAAGPHEHVNHTYMTINGGANWVINPMPQMDTIKHTPNMVSFYDEYNGIMIGREVNLNVSMTTNGAFSWLNNPLHRFSYNATGIKMIDPATTFIIANDSLYKSSDSLKTFVKKKLPFINYNNSIMANNASFYNYNHTTYFLTFNDHIYKSSDDFNTFTVSKSKNSEANYSIGGNGSDVYVYSTNGKIYKTTTITGISQLQTKSETLTLFPNPPVDDIINYSSTEKIKNYVIINSTGSEVMNKQAESNSINISNLASGVYLISFYNGNNKLVGTKKMIKMFDKR